MITFPHTNLKTNLKTEIRKRKKQKHTKKKFLPAYVWQLVYRLSILPYPTGSQQQTDEHSDHRMMQSLNRNYRIHET